MADETVVRDKVLSELSKASGVPKTRLKDEMKLRDDLQIAHQNYVTLAQNLRSFIRENNFQQTLLLNEIDTAAATVGSVFQLVLKRVNG
ncbi:MAG: hypothetical protein NT151_05635 [Acidobacteria bacterium]|nr:hypothetical protein [Acidobacteriota bacterium]